VPSRGEVWLVDMGMVEKGRPALVLSGPCGPAERNIITVIPHTTTLRGSDSKSTFLCHFSNPALSWRRVPPPSRHLARKSISAG